MMAQGSMRHVDTANAEGQSRDHLGVRHSKQKLHKRRTRKRGLGRQERKFARLTSR
jgi:hypothetical protein